ncbi:hypothetical protein ACQP2F_08615 [Actinoplanes sp. CA-030573]|uniref:hypothetical protein n=1 Tax=Actinoplanes sp. CA-030573 TaxID=3239898 RepID=UPI003D929690
MGLKKKTYGVDLDNKDRYALMEESKHKGSLYFEGTTKRRFALGDSIRTFRAGR